MQRSTVRALLVDLTLIAWNKWIRFAWMNVCDTTDHLPKCKWKKEIGKNVQNNARYGYLTLDSNGDKFNKMCTI